MRRLLTIMHREVLLFAERPLLLFTTIVAPLLIMVFFTTLMRRGLPYDLPCGIVDEDDTAITRTITRTLDAMMATDLTHRYATMSEARKAMQRGEVFAFVYIPAGTTEKILAYRQPTVAFYTCDAFFLPSALLMKDLRLGGELLPLAVARETLYAHGLTERQAMASIQPIVIEKHPLDNPTLNYSVYLTTIILPGIMLILFMLTTTYIICIEWKQHTQHDWLAAAGGNPVLALLGKLLPYTLLFLLLFLLSNVLLYRYLGFPCRCGLMGITLIGWGTVLAAQAFAVATVLLLGHMRFSLCNCSLWGVMSITLSGFSFPTDAMDKPLQYLSWLCPLRHYYLLYSGLALEGNPLLTQWAPIVALLTLILLPLLLLWRLPWLFNRFTYKP